MKDIKTLLEHLGGVHNHEYLPTWADKLLFDLLQHRERIGQGHSGVVYRLNINGVSIIAKVGFIESREVATQRFACSIGFGLPVYAAHLNVDIGTELDTEICPHCGPDWRTDVYKPHYEREDLYCWCDKVKDVLLMPEAIPVPKTAVSQDDEALMYAAAKRIMDYAYTNMRHSPEIKTVMRYRGRYVFIDFGDPLFIETIFDI
jgi:hypothetical protein